MTKIIFKKKDDLFVGFNANGHSGYAEFGKDILCSAISTLVQSTYLGLKKVLSLDVDFEVNEKKGVFNLALHDYKNQSAQVLLKTLYESLKDIEIGNEKYMKVEVYHEVY